MSQPAAESGMQRTPEQVMQERAMGAVSDVLFNLEGALDRARKGLKEVAKDGANMNVELALRDAIKDLDRVRKRLTQDTYYAVDDRLI